MYNRDLTSSCELTLTDGRNRLKTDAMEAVECLRNWLGKGIVNRVIRCEELAAMEVE